MGTTNDTLFSFGQTFLPYSISLFAAFLTILIGITVATLLKLVINYLGDLLSIEKSLLKLGSYKNLEKLSKTFTLTGFIAGLVWTSTVLVFLFAALQLAGFREANKALKLIFEFIPLLVSGSLVLLLGIILAYFTLILTTVFGTLGKFPATAIFSKFIAIIILIFSIYQALIIFGLSDEVLRFLVIGFVAASSLALGLAAKEAVSQTIRNIWNQKL